MNAKKECVKFIRNMIFATRFPGRQAIVHSIPERSYDAIVAGHLLGIRCVRAATAVKYGERLGDGNDLPLWFRMSAAFKPRYVYRISNCCVEVSSEAVQAGGLWFQESVGHYSQIIDLFSRSPKWGKRFTLSHPCCLLRPTGYYHFVAESLSDLLLCLEDTTDMRIVIPSTSIRYPFIVEYLDLLQERMGATALALQKVDASQLACADYCFVGLEGNSGFVHPDEVSRLRKWFLPTERPETPRLIYVSRRYSRRAFTNADDVEAAAKRHGFTVVYPEKMAVREQIALFYGADTIIGDHGAGLVNLLYGNPGAHVIELFSTHFLNDCFFRLAVTTGLTYSHLIAVSDKGWGQIPIDRFEALLKGLL